MSHDSLTLKAMKTLARGLSRTSPVVVKASAGGMYTDPEAPPVQQARGELLKKLQASAEGSVVPLSLEGVELSASCIAAILGPILRAIVDKHVEGRFVVVRDPTGRNMWDADAGLHKESGRTSRKLVCVWRGIQDVPELVGPVDDQVEATYEFVLRGWNRHEELATARALSIQAASNRLSKAATLGLLYSPEREAVPGGGAQYVYLPVA